MATYSLSADGARRLGQRSRTITLGLFGIVVAVGLTLGSLSAPPESRTAMLTVIPILVAGMALVGYRALARQRRTVTSLEIDVMPDVIRRRMIGFPDIEIARRDIAGLGMRAEGLVVRGAGRDQMIMIPREIDGFDVLAAELADAHGTPEAAGAAVPPVVMVWGPTVAVLAVLATVFISTNPLIVAPLALLLTAGAVWVIVIVRRSPHANPQMKRAMWMTLLPALSGLMRAWMLASGGAP